MDKTLRLWDIIEGKLLFIKDLQPFGHLCEFVKFAGDGKIIVVQCQEKVVGISINGDLMYTISVTNDKLIEVDQFKESLIHMIAHDLKNPLNIIYNLPDMLSPGDDLNLIRKAGSQMLHLITNMLDVQK